MVRPCVDSSSRRMMLSMASSLPDWVEPMAATLTQERFSGPEWIFERKLDGIRLLAFKNEKDVRPCRETGCRRTRPILPSSRRSRTCRCTTRFLTARLPAYGANRRRSPTTCSTSCGSMAATSPRCPSRPVALSWAGCHFDCPCGAWPLSKVRSHGSARATRAGRGSSPSDVTRRTSTAARRTG